MANYINSKGQQVDPTTMNDKYLERALAKSILNDDQDNITVLQDEMANRNGAPVVQTPQDPLQANDQTLQ